MTERIASLKNAQWARMHHSARITLDPGMPLPYRDGALTDAARTALRLETALDMETPYLFPGELIAFTRTVPNLPPIFSTQEWDAICKTHFIHEMGNVSNLSPDYSRISL